MGAGVSRDAAEDSANLRAEWLQYRSQLFDRDVGLPAMPSMIDELRRQIEDYGSIGVLTFMLNAERQIEEHWGWQVYDQLIVDFVKALQGLIDQGVLPGGRLSVSAVRSDEILCFFSMRDISRPDGSEVEWLRGLALSLEDFVRTFLLKRLSSIDKYTSHVGQALASFDPKVRVERVIYRAIREARGEVSRRTASAEEHGAMVLRGILSAGKMQSVFQPIFDLVEEKVAALEALSRGPVGSGLEDAESLFSLAERVNLIVELERLCRRQSLAAAGQAGWKQMIFLNMSQAAASDPDFLEGALLKDVKDHNLDPSRIVIEVTERTYAEHQDLFSQVMAELRKQGFRVAVDDLGSGYSNLASLAEIKPEFLKFDHHFTKDIHRHRIKQDLLGAILSFAEKMDTQVIAEGIENREEFEAIRRLGVPLGQGFYLAKPASIAAF